MSAILLVRHGQASFDADDYDQLSALGGEQAEVTGRALSARGGAGGAPWAVYSGTLRRQRQTAERCLAVLPEAPAPRVLPGLDEFDHREVLVRLDPRYAERTALAADIIATGDPGRGFVDLFGRAVARWVSGGHDAEYQVPWPEFQRRALGAMEEIAATLPPGRTALVFTSVGPIAAVAQALLGASDETIGRLAWSLVNCGITKVVRGSRGLRLSTFNDHAHLERDARLVTYR